MTEALITLTIKGLPKGEYLATSEDLPGLVAQGRTMAEAVEIALAVAKALVESYAEHGDELPQAIRAAGKADITLQVPVSIG